MNTYTITFGKGEEALIQKWDADNIQALLEDLKRHYWDTDEITCIEHTEMKDNKGPLMRHTPIEADQEKLKEDDLTIRQFRVLNICKHAIKRETNGEFAFTDKVEAYGLTKNQVRTVIDELRDLGYLHIDDGGHNQFMLTEKAGERLGLSADQFRLV